MFRIYRTVSGWVLEAPTGTVQLSEGEAASLTTREDLPQFLAGIAQKAKSGSATPVTGLLAPMDNQEVWAAGVTYYRSRDARMEESQTASGGDFYDRVYTAARPELFFKATRHRVVGPGHPVRIRKDSTWNVPEPELTLLISPGGKILGYTAGNDMSSRSIEGENPLYLPQAKVYDGSCAIGPAILVPPAPLPASTRIQIEIRRAGSSVFADETTLNELKRAPRCSWNICIAKPALQTAVF